MPNPQSYGREVFREEKEHHSGMFSGASSLEAEELLKGNPSSSANQPAC